MRGWSSSCSPMALIAKISRYLAGDVSPIVLGDSDDEPHHHPRPPAPPLF